MSEWIKWAVSHQLTVVSWGSSLLLSGALSWTIYVLCQVRPLELPCGGLRGERRRVALQSEFFRAFDPGLRWCAAVVEEGFERLVRVVPSLQGTKRWLGNYIERLLVRAGEPRGLRASEVQVSCLLAAIGFASSTHVSMAPLSEEAWRLVFFFVGLVLPVVRLASAAQRRLQAISRDLPAAVDLMALAMSSGSDFPSAIDKVTRTQAGPVSDEFRQLLFSLQLGMTRRAALLAMEDRVPVTEVSDFVKVVVLAEKKGASVADALTTQARTSRERRSVRAEEAAARAGVLLIGPMMLLVCCVLIIIVGPLLMASSSM